MERIQEAELGRAVMALLLSETAHELSVWGRVQASVGADVSPRAQGGVMVSPVPTPSPASQPVPRREVPPMPATDPLAFVASPTPAPTPMPPTPAPSSKPASAATAKGSAGCFDLYRSLHQTTPAAAESHADKETCQAGIRHRIEICRLCPLGTKRPGVLCGYGPLDAKIMFVGAGGNPHELEEGRMMTGEAAVLMDNIIAAMHSCNAAITKESIYYSNIIKCCVSPTGPQRASIAKTCVRYLREEVRLVQPKVILIWGQMAYSAMFGDDANIITVRGQMRRFEQIPAIATHHPLECIRSPKLKGPVWKDVRAVLALLKPVEPNGGVAG